jgi:hypothetical protein
MRTLALDLGTRAGWATCVDGRVQSGTWNLSPRRFDGGGVRYLMFRSRLEDLRALLGGIDLVVYEEVRGHLGVDAAHAYGGFLATLTAWCETHGVPYRGVTVQSIKLHATGKAGAKKDLIVAAAKERWPWVADDNEADALWILDLQRSGA